MGMERYGGTPEPQTDSLCYSACLRDAQAHRQDRLSGGEGIYFEWLRT
jgi:hypothetical protein